MNIYSVISKKTKFTKKYNLAFFLVLVAIIVVGFSPSLAQTYTIRSDVTTAIASRYTRSDVTPLLGGAFQVTFGYVDPASLRLVSLHSIPGGSPYYYVAGLYGEEYPLATEPPGVSEPTPHQQARFQSMRDMGADIVQFDTFTDFSGIGTMLGFIDNVPGLQGCPCVDFSADGGRTSAQRRDTFVSQVISYKTIFDAHPSAARTASGVMILFVYGTDSISPSDWLAARATLSATGTNISFVLYGSTDGGTLSFIPFTNIINAQMPDVDDAYAFGHDQDTQFSTRLGAWAGQLKPFGFAVQPGLDRITTGGGYIDPLGTGTEQSDFQRIIATANAFPTQNTFLHIATWDDMAEKTNFQPDSDYMTTRSDIAAAEIAVFKHQPLPSGVHLYITDPQTIYADDNSCIEEVTVINGSNRALRVSDQGNNPDGSGCTSSLTSCPPNTIYRTTLAIDQNARNNVRGAGSGPSYLTYQCTVTDEYTGATVVSCQSAPCILLSFNQPTGSAQGLRHHYYSVSDKTMGGYLTGQYVHQSPSPPYSYTAFLPPYSGTSPLFMEVLANGRQIEQYYNANTTNGGSGVALTPTNLAADDRADSNLSPDWSTTGPIPIVIREIAPGGSGDKVYFSRPLFFN